MQEGPALDKASAGPLVILAAVTLYEADRKHGRILDRRDPAPYGDDWLALRPALDRAETARAAALAELIEATGAYMRARP